MRAGEGYTGLSQGLGVCLAVLFGLLCNIMFQNGWQNVLVSQVMPDWLFLVFLFWGMRVAGLWLVWFSWIIGCVHSLIVDETLGFYSFAYAAAVLIVQNARFRLLVVSQLEHATFVYLLIAAYLLMSDLTFRLDGNGLQLPLLIAFFGHLLGWWCVNMCLQPLYPLTREKDLFFRGR